MKEFKAGDFTSGKMGEIFKACYLRDIAIINHKQFGTSYMIPDIFFRTLATGQLLKQKKFKTFIEVNFGSVDAFKKADNDDCFQEIDEYFGEALMFDNWFDILNHAIAN